MQFEPRSRLRSSDVAARCSGSFMQAVIAEEPKIWEEGERQVKLGAFLEEMGREKKS